VDSKAQLRAFASGAAAASALLLAVGFAWVRASDGRAAVEPELASYMSELQQQTHKLNLAIEAENVALAGFYLHEVGEVGEQIQLLFPEHDELPVAALARELLDPRIRAVRAPLERAQWEQAKLRLGELVAACNDCHTAAGHGFIRVELTTANPFSQSFAN
jgi:hypothetical protein